MNFRKLTALLIVVLPVAAAAAPPDQFPKLTNPSASKEAPALVPGGRTIGGPGAMDLGVGEEVFVLGNAFPDVCITVVNLGAGTVGIRSIETGGAFIRFSVAPGQSGASCYTDSSVFSILLVCEDQTTGSPVGPCSFQWRADSRQ